MENQPLSATRTSKSRLHTLKSRRIELEAKIETMSGLKSMYEWHARRVQEYEGQVMALDAEIKLIERNTS